MLAPPPLKQALYRQASMERENIIKKIDGTDRKIFQISSYMMKYYLETVKPE